MIFIEHSVISQIRRKSTLNCYNEIRFRTYRRLKLFLLFIVNTGNVKILHTLSPLDIPVQTKNKTYFRLPLHFN